MHKPKQLDKKLVLTTSTLRRLGDVSAQQLGQVVGGDVGSQTWTCRPTSFRIC